MSIEKMFSKSSLALLFVALAVPAIAFAAGGGGHGAHHETSIADTIPLWKNFALYAVIVLWGVSKLVASGWPSRRERILSEVEAGKKELEQAQALLEEAQQRISRLDEEKKEVQEGIDQDAEREFKKVVEAAHERAARIQAQAESSIEAERKALEVGIRTELAQQVVEKAKQRLKQEVSPEVDANLRSSALGGIAQLVQ